MASSDKNPALLPSGFVDLLPPVAEREAVASGDLMATFAGFGYERYWNSKIVCFQVPAHR
jgi:ATP phosphoribosyltransferase regulatory subunit